MDRGLSTSRELGRRAVACRRWRWLPAMLALYPDDTCDRVNECGHDPKDSEQECREPWPHFDDAATLGGLLALVREAYDDERAHVRPAAGAWVFHTLDPLAPCVTAPTEAQCLVSALEAAP